MPAVVSLLTQFLFMMIVEIYLGTCPLSNATDYALNCQLENIGSQNYDIIVVGAGSAGSIIANRLSIILNVLVIDAGMPPNNYSEVPLTHLHLRRDISAHDWYFKTAPGNYCEGYPAGCIFHQGRGIGGSSLISTMLQYEGNQVDFDEWGMPDWSWNNTKPDLNKFKNLYDLEAADNFIELSTPVSDNQVHNITQLAQDELNITQSFEPGKRMGYHDVPVYVKDNKRLNNAKAYLTPVKGRSSLCVIYNARVKKVLINPVTRLATGVQILDKDNVQYTVNASRQVVLSAGTINTPKLLMLSGIGPMQHLLDKGIQVVMPLEGVGKNLRDQMEYPLHFRLPTSYDFAQDLLPAVDNFCSNTSGPLGNLSGTNMVGYINTNITGYNTNFSDMAITRLLFHSNDTVLMPLMLDCHKYNDLTKWFITGKNLFYPMLILQPTLLKPQSVGYLELNTTNIDDPPIIHPNFLDQNTTDLQVLLEGVNHIKDLLSTEAFQDVDLLDVTAPCCLPYEFDTEAYWNCTVHALARPLGNPVGTCRMGPDHFNGDVVDSRCKVHNTVNLRIVDGSIAPTMTAGDAITRNVLMAEHCWRNIFNDAVFG